MFTTVHVRNESQDYQNQDMCDIQAWIHISSTLLHAVLWLRPSGYRQSASNTWLQYHVGHFTSWNQIQNLPSANQFLYHWSICPSDIRVWIAFPTKCWICLFILTNIQKENQRFPPLRFLCSLPALRNKFLQPRTSGIPPWVSSVVGQLQ